MKWCLIFIILFFTSSNANARNGGITEFSAATDEVDITVTSINDAPVLSTNGGKLTGGGGNAFGTANFTSILEDEPNVSNTGNAVSTFLNAAAATDVELGNGNQGGTITGSFPTGVAITFADNTNGTWQFSTNGTTFNTLNPAVNESTSVLLDGADANHKIRFVPNANFNGTATIKYRAWDGSDGSAVGSTANTSGNGGITPFSAGLVTKGITVTPVNDAPTLALDASNAGLTVNEDPGGAQSVASFITTAT